MFTKNLNQINALNVHYLNFCQSVHCDFATKIRSVLSMICAHYPLLGRKGKLDPAKHWKEFALCILMLDSVQAIFYWTHIVRHVSRIFDKEPDLRPAPTPLGQALDTASYKRTALSQAQAAQIQEIYELFDTDGGGCIDQRELQFAMTALGFQTKENHRTTKHKEALEVMDDLIGDGKVTLEEFSALMTGEISGQDPYEEARSVFTVLSRPDTERAHDGLITLGKLEAVCREYKVRTPKSSFSCLSSVTHEVK